MNKKMSVLLALVLMSGILLAQNKVSLKGTIKNQNSDSLLLRGKDFHRRIDVNESGGFESSFEIPEEGAFQLFDGTEFIALFLADGFDMKVTADANVLDESLEFMGEGSITNNYIAKVILLQEGIDMDALSNLDKESFEKEKDAIVNDLKKLYNEGEGIHPFVRKTEEQKIATMGEKLMAQYNGLRQLMALEGKACPVFEGYDNHAGGKSSLTDYRGKYVYMDIWATWCRPCHMEIPHLKSLEEKYRDKNIVFMSISIDHEQAYETWKNMVVEKELSGVQLYAGQDKDWGGKLMISGIPRFILVDPQGNVVKADAPRPSSEAIKELLESLDI